MNEYYSLGSGLGAAGGAGATVAADEIMTTRGEDMEIG